MIRKVSGVTGSDTCWYLLVETDCVINTAGFYWSWARHKYKAAFAEMIQTLEHWYSANTKQTLMRGVCYISVEWQPSTENSCSKSGRCLLTHQEWWSQQLFHISIGEKHLDGTFWKLLTPWVNVNFCVQVPKPCCSVSFVLVSQSLVQPSESYLLIFPTNS